MSTPQDMARHWAWWPASGFILLVAAATLVTRADADLWGHTRFGLDILETWSLPSDDPYSFTQDKPWVNHEWLSELAMGLAWTGGGARGLVLLKGLLLSGALFVTWTALRRTRVAVQLVALVMIAAGSLSMTSPLRPQLWTYLCLAILCRVLVADSTRPRRWLPFLFVVWANAHGGWVVGCGVLAAWAAGECWEQPDRRRQWIWLLPACIGATLINPYGIGLWYFIATTVRPTREILEWMPLWQLDAWFWIGWLLGLVVTAVGTMLPGGRRVARGLVLAMLAWGGLTVLRIGSLFLLSALILGAPALTRRWPAAERWRSLRFPEIVAAVLLVVVPGALAVRLGVFAFGCIRPFPRHHFDRRVVEVLQQAPPGRMVVFFDWGQYALWHLGPRIKVSMDGRRETVYSDDRLAEHRRVVNGEPEGLALMSEWNPEYVWLPTGSGATRTWLEGQGYRVAVENADSYLAIRRDVPALPTPAPAPVIRSCFPQ